MQSLGWYWRRLRGMSPGEIAWRLNSSLRDCIDCARYPILARGLARSRATSFASFRPGFEVTDVLAGEWNDCGSGDLRDWADALRAQAESVAAGKLSFFNLETKSLGHPIDWNRDHGSGKAAVMSPSPFLDYRDFARTGDAKFVWEPNRHQHLVVLGRAYRATGDVKFARAVCDQLSSWFDQCPFGRGMNWRSPLEFGVRLINWVWAMDLIRPAGVVSDELFGRVMEAVRLQVWDISRKYSRGSSANNHVIGEAAGVYVACRYFDKLPGAASLRDQARKILCDEILAQSFDDGGSREQALGYQLFVMQFFLLAALVGRKTGDEFSAEYSDRLEKMFEFAAAMHEGGNALPLYGDYDDGYVLDLGDRGDLDAWLPAAAVLFNRPDFKCVSPEYSQCARWLLDGQSERAFGGLRSAGHDLASRSFPESGIHLLQSGESGSADRISITFDVGELGYGPLAAHGHADALSFTLRAFGADMFVDPGTFDYFTYPEWRNYFRSTRAHNTIEVDGQDQSEMTGPFLWGARANARLLRWAPNSDGGGAVSGEHDGYGRLSDPVLHRRELTLDAAERTVSVQDRILATGRHSVAVYFHLAENVEVTRTSANEFEIETGAGSVTVEVDPRLRCEILSGTESPIGGWVSRGYHRKQASATLVGRCEIQGEASFLTQMRIGSPVEADFDQASVSKSLRSVGV